MLEKVLPFSNLYNLFFDRHFKCDAVALCTIRPKLEAVYNNWVIVYAIQGSKIKLFLIFAGKWEGVKIE